MSDRSTRSWPVWMLVIFTATSLGCARDPFGPCLGDVGYEKLERRYEASYDIPVELHFEVPEGRPPFQTVMRAETTGGLWAFQRWGNDLEYCMNGLLDLQRATSSFELMMEDGPFAFTTRLKRWEGTVVEREREGEGIHIWASRFYDWDEIAASLRPQLDRTVARWRADNAEDESEYDAAGLHYNVRMQRGIEGVEARGRLELDVIMKKPKGMGNRFAYVAIAEFTFPEADDD